MKEKSNSENSKKTQEEKAYSKEKAKVQGKKNILRNLRVETRLVSSPCRHPSATLSLTPRLCSDRLLLWPSWFPYKQSTSTRLKTQIPFLISSLVPKTPRTRDADASRFPRSQSGCWWPMKVVADGRRRSHLYCEGSRRVSSPSNEPLCRAPEVVERTC